jgi:hypothetical protein
LARPLAADAWDSKVLTEIFVKGLVFAAMWRPAADERHRISGKLLRRCVGVNR